ncbi:MAG TPA: transcription antitermination factor NusB [Nitrospinota bacterium]|nr:transcription antitermination factor NusB [Nitrospinota bacterium]
MGKRRRSREEALKIIYQYEIAREDIEEILRRYWTYNSLSDDIVSFATDLVRGTIQYIEDIDQKIEKYSDNWSLDRIGAVELGILRIAIYELIYRDDIPPKVSINEAIEIEKKFGSEDSSTFINGILDKVKRDIELKG